MFRIDHSSSFNGPSPPGQNSLRRPVRQYRIALIWGAGGQPGSGQH